MPPQHPAFALLWLSVFTKPSIAVVHHVHLKVPRPLDSLRDIFRATVLAGFNIVRTDLRR